MGQLDVKEMLAEWTGIPGVVIEADMNDDRAFAEGPFITRIEAFLETLDPKR
jgi:benzoyl-CoA reductase/2-hydroxyglutaryl-CoA dehydratase subunit BcrC/BadD/HgdB